MRQRLLQRRLEMIGRGDAACRNAEGFRELDEIRVDQIGSDDTAVEARALVAPDIAIGVIVEHQGYHADVVLHGGRELLYAEHEAAISGDRDHRLFGIGDLGAERGREARTERALIARREEGARLVDRKTVPGREAD